MPFLTFKWKRLLFLSNVVWSTPLIFVPDMLSSFKFGKFATNAFKAVALVNSVLCAMLTRRTLLSGNPLMVAVLPRIGTALFAFIDSTISDKSASAQSWAPQRRIPLRRGPVTRQATVVWPTSTFGCFSSFVTGATVGFWAWAPSLHAL